jgi:hypothetical protein
MELFLQQGHGMMSLCRDLVRAWGGGTVILSPRDLKPNQMSDFATSIGALPSGDVLLDPQLYLPRADHPRLVSHSYWPDDYETSIFWTGASLRRLVAELLSLNFSLGCRAFILPAEIAQPLTDDWFTMQRAIVAEARGIPRVLPLFATIALGADVAESADAVHRIIDSIDTWRPDGVYLVCEHPNGDYLVDRPVWLANILDLIAGLRLRGLTVIVGYANHQSLTTALAGANALASGNFLNVRSFPPEKFRQRLDDDPKHRGIWYYCPQALSEFNLPMLDLAQNGGMLPMMAPPAPPYPTATVAPLFGGAPPTTVGFVEPAPFRHYLDCLRVQCRAVSQPSFDATAQSLASALSGADQILRALRAAGVVGQDRDFTRVLTQTQSALAAYGNVRRGVMRRRWTSLAPPIYP